ncbi:hypothetical protein [Rickettsia endosymbiont of Ceutorhynchus obstrictus]|uniref:hypothetical protein n=1 Tax=Rickettsia endosymbiont of Ceutorhynchus obstrictus TaxID=3066249 RepID=UPI003132B155
MSLGIILLNNFLIKPVLLHGLEIAIKRMSFPRKRESRLFFCHAELVLRIFLVDPEINSG